MMTQSDIGSSEIYKAILKSIKETLPLSQKLFKKSFTKDEAWILKKLTLRKVEVNSLEFLKYFKSLEELNLEEVTGLFNLKGLRHCPQLKTLEIYHTNINDLQAVTQCKKLTSFCYCQDPENEHYEECKKSDFSFLKELSELEIICIRGNKVTDVSFLAEMHTVNFLVLEDNPISTIAPLKTMRNLSHLELEFCGLSSLDDIEEFPALKTVYAEGNHFTQEQREAYLAKNPSIHIDFDN